MIDHLDFFGFLLLLPMPAARGFTISNRGFDPFVYELENGWVQRLR
jgi:hypothetical protein